MDPNSRHQIWSLWTFTVTPGRNMRRTFEEVKAQCARFGRKAFGSASQMKVERNGVGQWIVKVRTERHPVHDPRYVEHQRMHWQRFFENGFGVGTQVTLQAKLEAGSRDDGTPADQLIIIPPLQIGELRNG